MRAERSEGKREGQARIASDNMQGGGRKVNITNHSPAMVRFLRESRRLNPQRCTGTARKFAANCFRDALFPLHEARKSFRSSLVIVFASP